MRFPNWRPNLQNGSDNHRRQQNRFVRTQTATAGQRGTRINRRFKLAAALRSDPSFPFATGLVQGKGFCNLLLFMSSDEFCSFGEEVKLFWVIESRRHKQSGKVFDSVAEVFKNKHHAISMFLL